MAKILIVHGISNQYLGEMELHAAWFPALCDGLLRVGHSPLPVAADCFCPFYGHAFRPQGHLGGAGPDTDDLEDLSDDEVSLLEAVWRTAAAVEADVPGPDDYSDPLVWAPRIAERALMSLARSKYLADHFPLAFLGDLRQVTTYLKDPQIHAQILSSVVERIEPETRVVVGHSLGSVIAARRAI